MKNIRKNLAGVAAAMAGVVLMASSPVMPVDEISVADVYFDETCNNGKFVTIYDSQKGIVFDAFVKNEENKNTVDQWIQRSDYLMSNSITDFYILHD